MEVKRSTVYVVQGFDISTFSEFTPDPAVFETEKEAKRFCREQTDAAMGLLFSYREVSMGRFL